MSPFEKVEFAAQWVADKRGTLGWSQQDVADAANELLASAGSNRVLKQQTIDQLERRTHKGVPDWFRYVKEAIDTACDDRRRGQESVPRPYPLEPDQPGIAADDIEMIPEVDLRYAMGDGVLLDDYPSTGAVPFNRQFRRTLTTSPVDKLFLARGDGDSMQPTLINDDLVLIDTAQSVVTQSDRIWAVAIGDAGMIKRVRVLSKEQYELQSDNLLIRPQIVSRDDLHVIGRVVWVGRRI